MFNFNIKTKDSADRKEIRQNIRENLKIIDKWVVKCQPNDYTAILVSAGPSLPKYIEKIKDYLKQNPKTKLFCVKHALPTLVKANIPIEACITLDPRPVDGVSTHGVKRKDLFENFPKGQKFLIAAMCHPSVVKHLQNKGGEVIGWHALSDNYASREQLIQSHSQKGDMDSVFKLNQDLSPENSESFTGLSPLITGGSCSAMRAIPLMKCLGFNRLILVSFDSSLESKPVDFGVVEPSGNPKYFQLNIDLGGKLKEYFTTPELAAAVQDIQNILNTDYDWFMDIWDEHDGLVQEIWRGIKHTKKRPTYDEYFNTVV
jgi:hypothetical protein